VLPTDSQISWQGHLLGLLGGAIAAVVFRRRREPQSSTSWIAGK
jgi:membrane associated rhomboid family serine protease